MQGVECGDLDDKHPSYSLEFGYLVPIKLHCLERLSRPAGANMSQGKSLGVSKFMSFEV